MAGVASLVLAGIRHFEEIEARVSSLDDRERAQRFQSIKSVARALRGLEWRIEDFVHYHGAKAPIDPNIVILGIDDGSIDIENFSAFPEDVRASRALQKMGRWPWSREAYALILDKLIAAGAATVVFDLMLPAPSAVDPEGDRLFRESLDRHKGRVLLGADCGVVTASGGYGSESISFPWEGFVPPSWPPDERIGFVSFWPDEDGVIRRARFFHSPTNEADRTLPSFAAAVARSQNQVAFLPNDRELHAFRFSDPLAYDPLPVHEIFIDAFWKRNFVNGEFFKGKTVFVGPSARQLQDYKATAIGTILGVQVHAHALAAVKSGNFLAPAPFPIRVGLIALLSFGAAAMVMVWRRPLWCMTVLLAVGALGFVVQLLFFDHASLLLPMTVPLTGWGLVGLIGLTYDYVVERREKEALRRRIQRFHSPDVVRAILADPEDYRRSLAGAKRTICILFSDVRGFTTMSESLPPEAVVAQLTEYLDRMVEVVFKHDGAIDKFVGDAVMAGWGRLREDQSEEHLKGDAVAAVAAALDMRRELAALNADWKSREIQELQIGIGIHQGEAIVGELGSGKAEFTAIGDNVNLASRLEGATKEYGTDLIISDVVYRRVKDRFTCRTADLVRVKGKSVPVEVFAVIGESGREPTRALDLYEQGIRFYRAGRFADALWLFQQAQNDGLDDSLTRLYAERCQNMIAQPPAEWDGVFVMTKK